MVPALTRADIAGALRALGLAAGDIVLLHSSLSSLGVVEGGAEALVAAFLDVLGDRGTLVVPTFGALGIVTDVVRKRPDAIHSVHPLASVAAVGPHASAICREHWRAELAHGPDTPYTRIADLGGYVCLLGVDQDRNTTLHTVEEVLRLPYLRTTADKTFETPRGSVTKSWPFFPGPHRDFIGLDRRLRESGKMKVGRVGNAVARLIRSADLISLAKAAGEADPAFVLCSNPNCDDCVGQRADLRRARFARESFQLAASASLAGRYTEEIADVCHAAGVDRVELDAINGLPVQALPPSRLTTAVERLRADGCEVVSLRASCVPADTVAFLNLTRELRIPRVVVPLVGPIEGFARAAAERGLAFAFVNCGIGSEAVSVELLNLKGLGLKPGFTFDAAAFAAVGEKPFLFSYKRKLRRFVDQLDLGDATFAGQPRPLAQGNAEIKEMLSILRCASFAGLCVLSARNAAVGSLADAVARLDDLLASM